MYEKFFNLTGKPFQLTPDIRFLFMSPSHKRALSYLYYGLKQGEGFVVITGDIGTGKTILIQNLLSEIADDIAAARVAVANPDPDSVVAMVAAAFGLSYESKNKVSLLKDLERFVLRCIQDGKRVLLVVDEAQTLTASALEELRMLSNMEVNGRALMQIFLIGQTELRDTMAGRSMEQMRQRVIATYQLSHLTLDETKSYIEHRLNAVGWSGDPALESEIFPSIHRWSEGIPRKINLLCDRLLLLGFLDELHQITASHVETVVGEMDLEVVGQSSDDESNTPSISESKGARKAVSGKRGSLDWRLRGLERRLTKIEAELEQERKRWRDAFEYIELNKSS